MATIIENFKEYFLFGFVVNANRSSYNQCADANLVRYLSDVFFFQFIAYSSVN